MWQTHAEYTKITVWVTHACKSTAGSAVQGCHQHSGCRGDPRCAGGCYTYCVCAVLLICMHIMETSGAALAGLWNIQKKKKRQEKKSLKHFRSQMEQIPSRDGGTVEKPRFTVALPRGRTSFRHKPCGSRLVGTSKQETVQVIRAEALDPCLH